MKKINSSFLLLCLHVWSPMRALACPIFTHAHRERRRATKKSANVHFKLVRPCIELTKWLGQWNLAVDARYIIILYNFILVINFFFFVFFRICDFWNSTHIYNTMSVPSVRYSEWKTNHRNNRKRTREIKNYNIELDKRFCVTCFPPTIHCNASIVLIVIVFYGFAWNSIFFFNWTKKYEKSTRKKMTKFLWFDSKWNWKWLLNLNFKKQENSLKRKLITSHYA